MDENIRANRENQPFLSPLKLVKLLTTDKFYHKLSLWVKPPIETPLSQFKGAYIERIRFGGYYLNPDKSIDIYGVDKVGFSLEQFWQNLVILDIFGRPRQFLEKKGKLFRPRIYGPGQGVSSGKDIHILMPVSCYDLKPGDTRFVSEDDNEQVTIASIDHLNDGIGTIKIHMINQFGEPVCEQYEQKALEDYGDWFWTIINI